MRTKKKQKKVDVFLLLKDFQKIIKNKPPVDKMLEEITIMGLKIKPILGDISLLDFSNKKIVEFLWSLGKFDYFFQKYYKKLSENELSIIFNYFDHFKNKLLVSLPKPFLKSEKLNDFKLGIFEIEILRSTNNRQKLN